MSNSPATQLIANLVVQRDDGRVLLVRYDPDGEIDAPDADVRWWLPAHELEPYQHPDEAAATAVSEIGGVEVEDLELARVQSFRGRRGWHVSFDYRVRVSGEPSGGAIPAAWFRSDDLPQMMHGNWERDTIESVVSTD